MLILIIIECKQNFYLGIDSHCKNITSREKSQWVSTQKKIFSIHKFYLLFRVFFIMFLIFEKYNLLRQDLTNNRRGLGIKPILE